MKIDVPTVRRLLQQGEFQPLFVEHLGWDRHRAQLDVAFDGATFRLNAIAHKRGFAVYTCPTIPDRPTRMKIDRQVTKTAREHLVIYTDAGGQTQLWEWVRREPGKPTASRDYRFHLSQSGDPLIQKLEALAIGLDEEEKLTIVEVAGRVKAALDVDKVTKRFYDRFKAEHAAFMKFIKGIKHDPDLQWYTSLMLNRLMFVYFIQKKGFLDGDVDYLRNRLARMQRQFGKDKFYSFYRYFLLKLFHDGLGKPESERDRKLHELLGKVPFLDGGFFEVHDLEAKYPEIDIPDAAFQKLFAFFDEYRWHLDERPLRDQKEINPDVVGYIFEKYVNQKQMGAYYTKEDITEYIAKNTIIPFLFDAAGKKCAIAFKPESALWRLLRDDPDRYIYPAVRSGVIDEQGNVIPESVLPEFVQKGMHDPKERMFDKRYNLGQAMIPDPEGRNLALPTETWREYVSRRQRCLELREKLRRGEVHQINDLITLNLDIWQFARDAIVNSEGPELLRAFYRVIAGHVPRQSNEKYERGLSVLDPTCGSGAFLFAALRILETLYSDCLERMRRFVDEADAIHQSPKRQRGAASARKYADFKAVLAEVDEHPNERYFVLKSIIISNLFGVDIMEEAVEICKLRLFLKLVAQVETIEHIEPLPDIDFNIRSGNTLVGFVSLEEVRKAMTEDRAAAGQRVMQFDDALKRIEDEADAADRAYKLFRETQVRHGGTVTALDKAELRKRLTKLGAELDRYLAGEYGVNVEKPKDFEAWKSSHQPFHWLVEFFGIMRDGGFDVSIGNPPYVVYSPERVGYTLRHGQYRTFPTKNLYAYVFERSIQLGSRPSRTGLIVQLTALSSERLPHFQDLVTARGPFYAVSFPRRPQSVFEGVEMPVSILLSTLGASRFITSRVNRFYADERSHAIETLPLLEHDIRLHGHRVAKIGSDEEMKIVHKLVAQRATIGQYATDRGNGVVFYQEACRYWLKAFDRVPFFSRNGKRLEPPHGRIIRFEDRQIAACVACVLNSSLFYWHYSAFADCEHVNDALLKSFPLPCSAGDGPWTRFAANLMERLAATATRKTIHTKEGHTVAYDEINAAPAKDVIDEIDTALARDFGLSAIEADFVCSYDIKYRMGGSDDGGIEQA